jgi:hypothetical protein
LYRCPLRLKWPVRLSATIEGECEFAAVYQDTHFSLRRLIYFYFAPVSTIYKKPSYLLINLTVLSLVQHSLLVCLSKGRKESAEEVTVEC